MAMFSYPIIILLFSCLIAGSDLPIRYTIGPNQIRDASPGWPNKGFVDIRHGPNGSLFAGTNNGLGKIDALPPNFSESEIEDNLYKIIDIDPSLPEGGNPALKTYPLDDDGKMLIVVSGIIIIEDPEGYCGIFDDSGNPYCQVGTGVSWSLDSGETWQYMDQPMNPNINKYPCSFDNSINCFDATWDGEVYEHGVYNIDEEPTRVANVSFEVAADTNYEYIYAASWYGLLRRFKYTDQDPVWESIPLPRDSDADLHCDDFPPENYFYGPFYNNHRAFSVEISNGYIWVGGLGVNKGEIVDENCINWTHYTASSTFEDSENYNNVLGSDWVTGIYVQERETGERIWTINWVEPLGPHHLSYTEMNETFDYGSDWVKEPYFSTFGSLRAIVYNLYSPDIDGELYASTSKGLFRFIGLDNWEKEEIADDEIFDEIGIANENSSNFEVRTAIIDQNNNLFVGTTDGLLVRDASNQFYYPSYIDDALSGTLSEMLVFPNPYLLDNHNEATFLVESTGNGRLEIYDFSMSKVFDAECALANQYLECNWDGLNNNGDRVANGVYFCKVQTVGKTYWEKLGVVKFE